MENVRLARTVAVDPGRRTVLQPLQSVRLTAGSLGAVSAGEGGVRGTHIFVVVFWPTARMDLT